MLTGKYGFIDSKGYKFEGTKKLECELTLRAGEVVYDLNGISKPSWTTDPNSAAFANKK
jgi:dihydroorotase